MAEKRRDTNVNIPKPALDRLSEIDWALGNKSRDETGRYLLLKYIERNETLTAADRLTHISTVMRHPLPPVPDEDPVVPTRRLRLRLPKSVSDHARALAFRIPGQAQSRGHTDYQSRLLTDAVMTSIAYECRELELDPIIDPVLAGIHPLLRQRAALGLWRLAVHATRTGAERAILREADNSRVDRETQGAKFGELLDEPRYVENVAALLEINDLDDGEAVWHHDYRFLLVQFLASPRFLSTTSMRSDPERWEQALYDQEGDDWQDLRAAAIELGPRPHGLRRRDGRPRPGAIGISFEGRGGGAVWRAQRILALPTIADWLSTSASSTSARALDIHPPGWQLAIPKDWNPAFLPDPPPDAWAEHIAEHRVLHFDLDQERPPGTPATRSRGYMVWPTIDDENGEPAPVAGLQTILTTLLDRTADARKAAEILLLELMPANAADGKKWGDRTAGDADNADDSHSASSTIRPEPMSPDFLALRAELSRGRHVVDGGDGDTSARSEHGCEGFAEQPTGLGSPLGPVGAHASESAPRDPGDVPPLPTLSRAPRAQASQDNTRAEDDAPDVLEAELAWIRGWQQSNSEGSGTVRPVFVPVETALQLGFIDNAHAQQLIVDATARTEKAMKAALRDASRDCRPADHAALTEAMNDPAQFSKLARKLSIDFDEVSAAWCWHVASLSDEVETNPARLRWLAAHLTEIYTRELDREMQEAVRAAARRFAHLHRP
ncbi:hypothetical protein [Rhodococcus triatomae]|nr:hypothetical protein G419_16770 [Rhodococcus triatomae BKS 15-14]